MDTPLLTARYYGDANGVTNYWYWIVGRYNWGIGPMSNGAPVTVLSLSNNNVVCLNWQPLPFVSTVDVLRTTTSAAPSGTSSVLIAGKITNLGGFTDTGLPTSSYTVVAAGPQMITPEDQKKQDEADQKKANEESEKAMEEFEKRKEEQAKIDQESIDKAAKANEYYNEATGFKAETAAQKQAREAAEKESKDSGSAAKSKSADKSVGKPPHQETQHQHPEHISRP